MCVFMFMLVAQWLYFVYFLFFLFSSPFVCLSGCVFRTVLSSFIHSQWERESLFVCVWVAVIKGIFRHFFISFQFYFYWRSFIFVCFLWKCKCVCTHMKKMCVFMWVFVLVLYRNINECRQWHFKMCQITNIY